MAEKGGVSPLVLFKGLTGNGQEVAHRELRLGVCGAEREGRRVRWRTPGRSSNPAQPLWEYRVSVLLLNTPHPSPVGQSPHEDCVPMRGRAEASFPLTLFALCELLLPRPYRYQHIHRGGTHVHLKRLGNTGVYVEPIRVSPHASDRVACS